MSDTVYVVFCPKHKHYLQHTSSVGTTWVTDADEAKRYPTKQAARTDARSATWLEHDPTPWAVSDPVAYIETE